MPSSCTVLNFTCTVKLILTMFTSTRGQWQCSQLRTRVLAREAVETVWRSDRDLTSAACGVRMLVTAVMELTGEIENIYLSWNLLVLVINLYLILQIERGLEPGPVPPDQHHHLWCWPHWVQDQCSVTRPGQCPGPDQHCGVSCGLQCLCRHPHCPLLCLHLPLWQV